MKKRNAWMGVVTIVGLCSPWGLWGATNTWDAEIGAAGAQDGSGVWSTNVADSNWWNHASANTNWVNSVTYDDLTVIGAGSGAAGTITLGEDITVGHLRFNAPGSGSYTLDGAGNTLGFGFNYPLLWVTKNVVATNRANSSSSAINLNVSGGGTLVLAGTNTFKSVDVMDAATSWFGITGGVAGTTITIPAGARLSTVGYPPVYQYATFGFRLRDAVTLNVDGELNTSSQIGGHSGEDNFVININPGAVVTNSSTVILGWNSPATLNMNGGLLYASGVYHMDGNTGTLNLNGGTLEVNNIYLSAGIGWFNVNFNGGLLKARASSLFNETSTKNYISSYWVKDGGAWIDSNGQNVEAIAPFTRGGSGGLTKSGVGTMSFSGGSYTGATTVTAGTLNLNVNRRAAWAARDVIGEYFDRSSRVVLNGGNLAVTGRAAAPSATRTFTLGKKGTAYDRGARNGNTSGLVAGMTVTGEYIPAGTYVTYVNDSSKLTISQAATNTSDLAMPLTFGGVTNTTWQTIDTIDLQQSATLTVNASGGPGTVLAVGAVSGAGSLTKSGDGVLALYGPGTYAGSTVIQNGTVKLTSPVVVTNASFEMHAPLVEHPPYGYFTGAPANTFWTYHSSAGIAALGSTWVSATALIDGASAAFVQTSGTVGGISTTVVLPSDGRYVISFLAGKRPTTPASAMIVAVDGNDLFQFEAAEFSAEGSVYSGSALLTAGTHTLMFKGVYTGVDTATWIDRVSVSTLADGEPDDNLLPTGTALTVMADGVLDLGGAAQTVAVLSGSGLVTNGALTVTGAVSPAGNDTIGVLTVAADMTVNGSLSADTALDGTCDRLTVQGALDVAGAVLQIQDPEALNTAHTYVLATCAPGSLTGTFASTNLGGGTIWRVKYKNADGEIRLEVLAGTLFTLF